ncbi:MAG TPA: M14 metallopeptidase family protein [Pyrinomonadaceae bacterium]|nr:M14 metallopeptidase family protein [Pyrinomonadaceae bacterium]
MPRRTLLFALILAALLSYSAAQGSSALRADAPRDTARATSAEQKPLGVPAPSDVLGFTPGDDRRLASWAQTVEYFRRLAASSDRVRVDELGKSTMGAPFVLVTISAPENLARLDEFRGIQRQLADPRTLGANPDLKAEELIRRGKAVVLITCGVHSTEVGSYLSGMLIAHRLAASNEPEIQEILRNTIILLVPSLNPDGVDIVKNWYDRTLGTPYEGTSPPELYHKYVGHDDNRDWYAFTQVETQLTVDKVHNVWHPQIVHDIHQQGAYGSRLFLPPYMKPVEPNVPRQIVEGYTELGHFIADDMLKAGFRGITWDSTYDAWTPSRAYSHYHGGVRILSETASVQIATPITVKPDQLREGEGYDARKAAPNIPVLWPGGEWHMRDITNYMTTAAFELLKHASSNREAWLRRFYSIGKDAVRPRRPGELFAFVVPPSENSPALLNILTRGDVEIDIANAFTVNNRKYPKGTAVIRMAQPYGSFAKALLERQHYPDLRDESGRPIPPYDVTAHTLSLLMGVEAEPISTPFKYIVPMAKGRGWNGGCGGGIPPRRAIYKSHIPSLDEGWTRWVLEHQSKCIYYSSLEDKETRAGNLRAKYDTIIIPDQSPRAILEGYRKGSMPDELTGGLGSEGVKALREFVEQGGTLVTLNQASDFAVEQFGLPLRDVTEGLKRTEFYCPGSILRTILDTTQPVAKGMLRESIAWVEDSPVFEVTNEKTPNVSVRVVARYPEAGTPLLSGWLLGAEKIRGKAALLDVSLGKGHIYLFGFRPQYRGQSLATYPLFFNAVAGVR